MGGSVKKAAKKIAKKPLLALAGPNVALAGLAAQRAKRVHDKHEEEREQARADNAVLTKELDASSAAGAEAKKIEEEKKKRQGLGAAISGGNETLG